jgi:ABC-type nitrate/sulfonate/bicarbonate transport system ATPase subunit
MRDVVKRYAAERPPVLEKIAVEVAPHECVSLVGRSGCGKTTLLNMIAGFVVPTDGEVLVDGVAVRGPGRDRGVVFQHLALFPWLSAAGNVEFGLRAMGVPRDERRRRALELLGLVHLERYADHYIRELSGGMQQRVALARALATRPAILLLDEPFGAVDALTRLSLQRDLLELRLIDPRTIVLVTHDISEAVLLSDRVAIMGGSPSRIVEMVDVRLDRPRQRTDPAFNVLCEDILAVIGS